MAVKALQCTMQPVQRWRLGMADTAIRGISCELMWCVTKQAILLQLNCNLVENFRVAKIAAGFDAGKGRHVPKLVTVEAVAMLS